MSPPSQAPAADKISPGAEGENPELIRFREEWLAELRRQGKAIPNNVVSKLEVHADPSQAADDHHPPSTTTSQLPVENAVPPVPEPSTSKPSPKKSRPTTHPALQNGGIAKQFPASKALDVALGVYRQAVEYEERGELDQALVLYRQAFRLHDNVDRAYHRELMLKSILKEQQESTHRRALSTEVEDLSASFESIVTIKPTKNVEAVVVTGALANIVQSYPSDLKFEAEHDKEPVFLNSIPEEILVMIISKLDPTSVERFATVNKKARVLTLDSGIWRPLVRRTYHPPQISDIDMLLKAIEYRSFDYRRVFIEQPRLRLDGVYIATCHYIRPGLSENHWVNVSHLITYHRYLRFLPNGQVLSLLANEEHAPRQIIPLLKPTLRMKGLFLGQWRLTGTTLHISNLVDASGRYIIPEADDPPTNFALSTSSQLSDLQMRYVFTMTLNLRSRPLGRWNKMDIQSYDSVNIETGDTQPVALKHERPFWFSKVRSYA